MSNWLDARLEEVNELAREGFIKPPITHIYELWGSTGMYSDYTEYRIAFCSSQEELDKTVERFMTLASIEQAPSRRNKEKPEDYIVMKHADGHWTGRVTWQQHYDGLTHMSRSEEMEIWSNVVKIDEDFLEQFNIKY